MLVFKILRHKAWDLFPLAGFIPVAATDGDVSWPAGLAIVVWVGILVVRYIISEDA